MPKEYLEPAHTHVQEAFALTPRLVSLREISELQSDLMRIGEAMPAPADWKPVCALTEAQLRFMGPEFAKYCTKEIVDHVKEQFGREVSPGGKPMKRVHETAPEMLTEKLPDVAFSKRTMVPAISRWAPHD